jgi:hypothetical protein
MAPLSPGATELRRNLILAFLLCFMADSVFAQSRLTGKWQSDRTPSAQTTNGASRNQSVQLQVSIDGDKASGTLDIGGLGGTFYVFQDSKVTGNKVQFLPDSRSELAMWAIELVDDNTVMLYREGLPLVGNNVLDLRSRVRCTTGFSESDGRFLQREWNPVVRAPAPRKVDAPLSIIRHSSGIF